VAVDSAGKFVFAVNDGSNNLSVYKINSTTGALTPVAGSPFATGNSPYALAITPNATFVYVGNDFAGTISAYRINPTTGVLTEGSARSCR